MSTIPNDFVNFLVPVIQEFDGVVEQVRYENLFLYNKIILFPYLDIVNLHLEIV
jgi:hypothetical protein